MSVRAIVFQWQLYRKLNNMEYLINPFNFERVFNFVLFPQGIIAIQDHSARIVWCLRLKWIVCL